MHRFRCLVLLMGTAVASANLAADSTTAAGEPASPDVPPASAAAPHAACLAACEAIEVECAGAARGATQQCMRQAATGGVDPLSMRRNLGTYYCGYFSEPRCGAARDLGGCALRYHALYTLCGDFYTDNVSGRYFDCKASEDQSLKLCRDELRACRASCGEP